MKQNAANESRPPVSGCVTRTYSDGGTYTGEFQNGKPHGKGKRVLGNGDEYDGEWENGKFHGYGTRTIVGKGTYVGDFVVGCFCGTGIFYGVNGSVYVGEWLANKKHGIGRYTSENGCVYEGQFENGKRHGCMKRTKAATGAVTYERWENGKRVQKVPAPTDNSPQGQQNRTASAPTNGRDAAAVPKSSVSSEVEVFGPVKQYVPPGGKQVLWTKGAVLFTRGNVEVLAGELPSKLAVAVKLQRWPKSVQKENIDRAQEEARVMMDCQHPHIVTCYGCETDMSKTNAIEVLIFSEKCQCSLDSKEGKLTMVQVREYTSQIVKALVYLHGRGIVHRDLKPANVLLSESGVAKVTDFGESKDTDRRSVCKTGETGTFEFMAPEVLMADGSADSCYNWSADVWSLGCTVLALLGHEPWVGSVNLYTLRCTNATPTGVPKDCPPRLKDFLSHCFDRKPEKRWTAAQLLEHRWLKDGG